MNPLVMTRSQLSAPRLPGTWKLEPGRAITLRPREDGVLKIAHGDVWLTFDGPHHGPGNAFGDRLLGAGEELRLPAGTRLVMESGNVASPVYFSWDFAFETETQAAPAQAVSQSWDDLLAAVGLGLRAGWRLAGALVRLGARTVLPRPAFRRMAT